jgi:hypothetical protein
MAMAYDRYILPNLVDFSNNLHGCMFFTEIDLVKGYHQVPIAATDIPQRAIITPLWALIKMAKQTKSLTSSGSSISSTSTHLHAIWSQKYGPDISAAHGLALLFLFN